MSEHDTKRELIALYILGCLPKVEHEQATAHLSTCQECRSEYASLLDAVGLLGYIAEPLAEEHLPRLVRTKAALFTNMGLQTAATRSSIHPKRSQKPKHQSLPSGARLQSIAAAAALLIVLATSVLSFILNQSLHSVETALSNARQRLQVAQQATQQTREQLALLLAPTAHRYDIPQGTIVRRDDRLYLIMGHLPALPPGHVFQTWTLPRGAVKMKPGSTFTPSSNGSTLISLSDHASTTTAIAVSVEPSGGSLQPTSTPVFIRTFPS